MANDSIRGSDGPALTPWAASAFRPITLLPDSPGPCPSCGSVDVDHLPPLDVRDMMDVLDHLWDDE